ncbi:MAG: hypothetical protein FJ267_09880, partial [Planctomycetes bacterium]|nr:hypothetical protein [Planctomycetota bacterium]
MKPFFRKLVRVTVAVGISALVGEGADAQLASEGIVRITKPKTSAVINQQQALPPQTFNQPTYSQYSTSQSVAAQLPAPQQVSQAPSVLPPLHSTPTQPVQATQSARPIQQASAIRQ